MIGVLEYSEAVDPEKHGLYFMDTPGEDIDSITGMVAGGAQIILLLQVEELLQAVRLRPLSKSREILKPMQR